MTKTTKMLIRAVYHADVELVVTVPEGCDATCPANWDEIESEHQTDYRLYDVESAEPYEDD